MTTTGVRPQSKRRYFLAVTVCALLTVTGCSGVRDSAAGPGSLSVATDKGPVSCAADEGRRDCLGIPYAAPPTGQLRWRGPAEAAPWQSARDATKFGPECFQAHDEYNKAQTGSEDCLYVNVYTPAPASHENNLPVMVWFHGGGFVNGSGNAFRGDYLAQTANAVVVTVNSRLGPFGWLALPALAAEAPDHTTGNYGLLDQIAALRWVKRNIAAFGGDPGRVGIVGQSAGGEQVLAHLASPYSEGLFQRAISMSAPAALSYPTVEQSAATRTGFLAELGCQDPATQPACLRSKTSQQLLDAAHENWNVEKNGLAWTATIDGAVLPDQPVKIYESGRFNKVPTMIGQTKDEHNLLVAVFENDNGHAVTADEYRENMYRKHASMAKQALERFPVTDFPSPAVAMAQAEGDPEFSVGEDADRVAIAKYAAVYGYQSCYADGPPSHVVPKFITLGCAHDSDLTLLFQWEDFSAERPKFTPEQQASAEELGQYWGNFAATGNPNGKGLPDWPAYQPDTGLVELLEPASTGGPRPDAHFREEHHFDFWAQRPVR